MTTRPSSEYEVKKIDDYNLQPPEDALEEINEEDKRYHNWLMEFHTALFNKFIGK